MKGASPIARLQQAEIEIASWLRDHLADAGGALEVVLLRYVKGSDLLLNEFEQPLVVLARYCQRVLDSDYLLKELVRDADIEWGRAMGERPHFEKEGSPCDPNDPYTVESVRNSLCGLLKQLPVVEGCLHGLKRSKRESAADLSRPGGIMDRNLHFGIREHAMGAILNGMALVKVRAYGSGFLIFSDYARGRDSAQRTDGATGHPHLHARLDCRGGRWSHASADRTAFVLRHSPGSL